MYPISIVPSKHPPPILDDPMTLVGFLCTFRRLLHLSHVRAPPPPPSLFLGLECQEPMGTYSARLHMASVNPKLA